MRFHRFFINEKIGDEKSKTIVSDDLVNQIKKVFRFKTGDRVILFDNSGYEYITVINNILKDSISFNIEQSIDKKDLNNKKTYLFASIVKKDTFEWIVEKATELGVSDIIPVVSMRSEKKNINEERLNKISIEASEQSGRVYTPNIHNIKYFSSCFDFIKDNKIRAIAFHTKGEPYMLDKVSMDMLPYNAVFVGPEGGYTDEEIGEFRINGIPIYKLGEQILRSETAVVVALTKII